MYVGLTFWEKNFTLTVIFQLILTNTHSTLPTLDLTKAILTISVRLCNQYQFLFYTHTYAHVDVYIERGERGRGTEMNQVAK